MDGAESKRTRPDAGRRRQSGKNPKESPKNASCISGNYWGFLGILGILCNGGRREAETDAAGRRQVARIGKESPPIRQASLEFLGILEDSWGFFAMVDVTESKRARSDADRGRESGKNP